jgi:hypothetical protein
MNQHDWTESDDYDDAYHGKVRDRAARSRESTNRKNKIANMRLQERMSEVPTDDEVTAAVMSR